MIDVNISIIGGGSFGTALAQILSDNGHNVLIRDINKEFVEKININHLHPFFDISIPEGIRATLSLDDVLNFSDIILLCVPTKVMRSVIQEIGCHIKTPKIFVNVSKGIEPETSYLVSQIIEEVLPIEYIKGFVCLSGPSFAEEIMHRKVTLLVSASKDSSDASYIQQLFNNPNYVRVYTSSDMIGVEVCGAVKNAIALISGVCQGLDLGMNARAALLTRSNREIIEIVKAMGGEESTCYGLTGIGDLMLTASSTLSRNFQAGMRIGNGETLESVIENSKNVVEGVRAVKACEEIRIKYNLELPILSMAYKVLYDHLDVKVAVKILLSRELKRRHVNRLRAGECTIEMGFILSDVTTSLERIADHCSNIGVCVTQVREDLYDTHSHLDSVKNAPGELFHHELEVARVNYMLP